MSTRAGSAQPPDGRIEVEVAGRRVRVSNPDKVLWPEAGFTKRQMIHYYLAVAPWLLPHVAGRPITMRRFPDGVTGLQWYQTECRGRPEWLRAQRIVGPSGYVHHYCLVDDEPSLVWVANLATIELHPFLALGKRPDRPLTLVFDLDPGPPAGLIECCRLALRLREHLQDDGLRSWPKASGQLGIHVYVPLNTDVTFDDTKAYARGMAARLREEDAAGVTDRPARAERRGKVFVDWSQNDAMKSTVAPYSLRASSHPLVSAPVTWDEVREAVVARDPRRLMFEPGPVLERLRRSGDPFRPVLHTRQALPSPPVPGGGTGLRQGLPG